MKTGPVTILVVHTHSSCNAGDRALLECGLTALRSAFDKPRLQVCANYPDEDYFKNARDFKTLPSTHCLVVADRKRPFMVQILAMLQGIVLALLFAIGLERFVRWIAPSGWRQLISAYKEADLVAVLSGNHFLSTGRFGWPFPVTWMGVALAHLFRKPLYVFPQSIGPLKRGWERVALRWIYSRARLVCLRDSISLRLAEEIGLPAKLLRYAPDPAFDYPAAPHEEALKVLADYGFAVGEPAIGVTVIATLGKALNRAQVEAYYASMARILLRAVKIFGTRIFIFCQVTGPSELEDDRIAARQVLEQIGDTRNIKFVKETLPPALLKACYGCMDFFIASRLHSGIFALGMGIPTLFVGYLTKTRGVLEALGLSDWVVDLAGADDAALWAQLSKGWLDRNNRASRIRSLLPGITLESHKVEKWIEEDYANL